jgi:hypothetical protein
MKLNKLVPLNRFLILPKYFEVLSYSILFLLTLSLFSCSSEDDSNVQNPSEPKVQNPNNGITNPDPVTEPTLQTLDKKGIGMSYKQRTWSTRIGALKPFWSYSWNRDYREAIPDGVEFVPMFWGASNVTDSEIQRIKELVDSGVVKNVLGFNEPDLTSQANMTWLKLLNYGQG